MRVLLDLDCVLGDFVGATAHRFGLTVDELIANWVPGEHGIVEPINVARHRYGPLHLTTDGFWRMLDGDERFWANMPELPWFNTLVDLAERYDPNWKIVTTASWCPSSWSGKVKWVQSRFGNKFPSTRLHITACKEEFAAPDRVLIDDNEENINKYVAAGGIGLLFPVHHNKLCDYKEAPMVTIVPGLKTAQGAIKCI